MRYLATAAILGALSLAGCGEYDPFEAKGRRSAAPEAVGVVVDPMSPAPPAAPKAETPTAEAPAPGPPAVPPAQQAPIPRGTPRGYVMPPSQGPGEPVVREKADVGMGRKGHYSRGFITTPLSTFWRTQEMVAYRTQVPHALSLYKATYGHFPKTQEEFEQQILKPNGIKLPELPEGHRYFYDPQKGELLVESPR